MKKILNIIALIVSIIIFGSASSFAASPAHIELVGPNVVVAGQTYDYSYFFKNIEGAVVPTTNQLTLDSHFGIAQFVYNKDIFDLVGTPKSDFGLTMDTRLSIISNETKTISVPVDKPLITITLKVKDDAISQTTSVGRRPSDAETDAYVIITDIKVTGAEATTNVVTTTVKDEVISQDQTSSQLMTIALIALSIVVVALLIVTTTLLRKNHK